MHQTILRCLVACFIFLLLAEQSQAIPAFARKYNMSCSVCHSPFPKLKPYGNEFAGNGFQMKEGEPPRFTRETGDDHLLLMRELPLAFRFDGLARFSGDEDRKADIEWPYILKILSAGQIARNISYYMYFLFNERGEVAGVEDAFLYFNNIGGTELDVTAGQFQVSDPIFKREIRPTLEDYQVYKVRPGRSLTDLTYDRGLTLSYDLPTETEIVASILNGNGIGGSEGGFFDNDKYKNFFLRLAHPLDSLISIGGMGYYGKELQEEVTSTVTIAGGDMVLGIGNIEVCLQYLYRKDTNPFFRGSGDSAIVTNGGFAQLMYAPKGDNSDWYIFLIYNRIHSDVEELTYSTMAGNFTYMLARNIRLIGEYGYDFEQRKNKFTVGFSTAF